MVRASSERWNHWCFDNPRRWLNRYLINIVRNLFICLELPIRGNKIFEVIIWATMATSPEIKNKIHDIVMLHERVKMFEIAEWTGTLYFASPFEHELVHKVTTLIANSCPKPVLAISANSLGLQSLFHHCEQKVANYYTLKNLKIILSNGNVMATAFSICQEMSSPIYNAKVFEVPIFSNIGGPVRERSCSNHVHDWPTKCNRSFMSPTHWTSLVIFRFGSFGLLPVSQCEKISGGNKMQFKQFSNSETNTYFGGLYQSILFENDL